MELQNDTFLRALKRECTQYTPIWLMRQAGRFLPEYRALRTQCKSFMGLVRNPQAATVATLQPVERFGLDAAILFSDILTIPDAMGLGLEFVAGEGPKFLHPVRTDEDVKALFVPDPSDKLQYVMDAVSSIRRALNGRVPLIGFSGSPFTLACYMVEGSGSREFPIAKKMLYSRPDLFEKILDVNVASVASYLIAQVKAGAQAIQLFDTWGGMLTKEAFLKFSLKPMQRVIEALKKENPSIPVILFTKGGGLWLEEMSQSGADCLGLDWTNTLSLARARTKDAVSLQGNMDPTVLLATDEAIEKEAKRILEDFGQVSAGSGHVFNLGHGVLQQTEPEAVKALVDCVHSASKAYHGGK